MTLAEGMLVGMSGSLGTVLLGLAGLWVKRRLTSAQVDDTKGSAEERTANARKTDAETWGLLNGNLLSEVERLNKQVAELLDEVGDMRAHIVDVHEWDAAGRPGPLPQIAAKPT